MPPHQLPLALPPPPPARPPSPTTTTSEPGQMVSMQWATAITAHLSNSSRKTRYIAASISSSKLSSSRPAAHRPAQSTAMPLPVEQRRRRHLRIKPTAIISALNQVPETDTAQHRLDVTVDVLACGWYRSQVISIDVNESIVNLKQPRKSSHKRAYTTVHAHD
ncbi:hypothetical protein MY10362_007282 [Beauveria mimosiformis]